MAATELLLEMTPARIALARSSIPTNGFVTAQEIAAMVAWMASPDRNFTTGDVFDISGGQATY